MLFSALSSSNFNTRLCFLEGCSTVSLPLTVNKTAKLSLFMGARLVQNPWCVSFKIKYPLPNFNCAGSSRDFYVFHWPGEPDKTSDVSVDSMMPVSGFSLGDCSSFYLHCRCEYVSSTESSPAPVSGGHVVFCLTSFFAVVIVRTQYVGFRMKDPLSGGTSQFTSVIPSIGLSIVVTVNIWSLKSCSLLLAFYLLSVVLSVGYVCTSTVPWGRVTNFMVQF